MTLKISLAIAVTHAVNTSRKLWGMYIKCEAEDSCTPNDICDIYTTVIFNTLKLYPDIYTAVRKLRVAVE
jgi:hypothetical protein